MSDEMEKSVNIDFAFDEISLIETILICVLQTCWLALGRTRHHKSFFSAIVRFANKRFSSLSELYLISDLEQKLHTTLFAD